MIVRAKFSDQKLKNLWGHPRYRQDVGFFTQAIALDPSHADSHAGLAEALVYAGIFGMRPSAETCRQARISALKALELDDSNAAAHNALA